jgi:RimJ/RimL family protein N-acetyltransferase
MSSIILREGKVSISRDEFIQELKKRNVDTRPFFTPMSSFPMFEDANNPVSRMVGLNGINLPSGHNLDESMIDYACAAIKEILGKSINSYKKTGILSYKDACLSKIEDAKKSKDFLIDIKDSKGQVVGNLKPLGVDSLNDQGVILKLKEWREKHQDAFPAQFTVTTEGTKKWLENLINESKDRILFLIYDNTAHNFVGHIGLFRFDFSKKICEIDNVVRGEISNNKTIMSAAIKTLMDWTYKELAISNIYLRVFSDNPVALSFYDKHGFKEVSRQAMVSIENGEHSTSWIPLTDPYLVPQKYFVTMIHKK